MNSVILHKNNCTFLLINYTKPMKISLSNSQEKLKNVFAKKSNFLEFSLVTIIFILILLMIKIVL